MATYNYGDWVIYDPGYKTEIGRVTEDKGTFVGACYHLGCTAAFTNREYLRPVTEDEIHCPDAKDCPKFGRCNAQTKDF